MPLWLAEEPLVLASKSEIRREMLYAAGIPVEVVPADIDERSIERQTESDDAGAVAGLLAREKACAVAAMRPGRLVVGADQTLALGSQRFSKPADRMAACKQLQALRGHTHELHSAVALAQSGAPIWEHREAARLTMRGFSDGFLEAYLDRMGAAVTASVGGYQLEQVGIQLFDRIDGDHFVILGLPLFALLQVLRDRGLLAA
jgi:septum formation protein